MSASIGEAVTTPSQSQYGVWLERLRYFAVPITAGERLVE
jgi:hypothetical protein